MSSVNVVLCGRSPKGGGWKYHHCVRFWPAFKEEICIVCVVVVPGYGSNYAHQESQTQVSGAPPITK
jgi:hypothetical protein